MSQKRNTLNIFLILLGILVRIGKHLFPSTMQSIFDALCQLNHHDGPTSIVTMLMEATPHSYEVTELD